MWQRFIKGKIYTEIAGTNTVFQSSFGKTSNSQTTYTPASIKGVVHAKTGSNIGGKCPMNPGIFFHCINRRAIINPKFPKAGSVIISGTGINPFASIKNRLKLNLPSNVSFIKAFFASFPGFCTTCAKAPVGKKTNRKDPLKRLHVEIAQTRFERKVTHAREFKLRFEQPV